MRLCTTGCGLSSISPAHTALRQSRRPCAMASKVYWLVCDDLLCVVACAAHMTSPASMGVSYRKRSCATASACSWHVRSFAAVLALFGQRSTLCNALVQMSQDLLFAGANHAHTLRSPQVHTCALPTGSVLASHTSACVSLATSSTTHANLTKECRLHPLGEHALPRGGAELQGQRHCGRG